MNFGSAIEALKFGHKVKRSGWSNEESYIALQTPDENSKMGHPYIYIRTCTGKYAPWTVSNQDILAEDWELV